VFLPTILAPPFAIFFVEEIKPVFAIREGYAVDGL